MSVMVEWLRRTIEGDKAAAVLCAAAPWVADVPDMIHVDAHAIAENRGLRHLGYVATVQDDAYRQHIALHDPRDTIARCEAELKMLDRLERDLDDYESAHDSATILIPLLASGYQHRDGYQPEWAPA